MAATRAVPAQHFRLTLADREISGVFRECSGLDSETEITEQRAADERGQPVVQKVAGATKWSNITLRRGIDQSLDLWQWRDAVHREGPDAARADGTIELVDYEGATVATYRFRGGWPVRYSGAAPAAAGNDVAMEEIVIAHEGLERV
jgi:phage tail-like protein